jgi:hypothetical protein
MQRIWEEKHIERYHMSCTWAQELVNSKKEICGGFDCCNSPVHTMLSIDSAYGMQHPFGVKAVLEPAFACSRESFRETVLDENGRLRWSRLENLIEEGSKSLDYDPQQLWMLAKWVLGPQGQVVRKPLVDELARLMDAATAGHPHPSPAQTLSKLLWMS